MRALSLLFYSAVFSIPFGTRKLIYQFTPGFHEYEAAFVYASDILLVLFLIAAAYGYIQESKKSKKQENRANLFPERSRRVTIFLAPFLFLAGVSVFFAPSFGLALYSFARLFTATAFAVASAYVVRQGIVQLRHVFGILAASAVFQSLVAFAQFVKQGSVGLWFLGEPMLSATAPGIAKFTAEGGKILRAYGTFPHPNVLGAFLVVGLLSLCYLYLRGSRESVIASEAKQSYIIVRLLRRFTPRNDTIYIAGIFAILVGLILTFSRSAWLVAIISSGALLLYGLAHSEFRRRASLLLFTLVASGYTLVAIFSPLIFPRAQISATEPSVVQRLEYNRLGVTLIAQHPFGVGIGNQVFYSVRNGLYEKFGMTSVWQWEPIHNIYLLIASEIGVAGGLSFILLLALLLMSNIKYQMSKFGFRHFIWNLEFGISVAMLLSLLAFGLVDHFLWTLRPGQLMLWLAIGMLWGVSSDDDKKEEKSDVRAVQSV